MGGKNKGIINSKLMTLMVTLFLVLTLTGCVNQLANNNIEKNTNDGTSESESSNKDPSNCYSVEDAKTIALNHAGLSANEVVFVIAEYDNDIFVPHYDIEFTASGYEYDYEINAKTGSIIDFDKELYNSNKQDKIDTSNFITTENAKSIALQHACLSENDISNYKCELDTDDLIVHYEIEFNYGKYEYEFEINAKTGSIMFSEKEIDD